MGYTWLRHTVAIYILTTYSLKDTINLQAKQLMTRHLLLLIGCTLSLFLCSCKGQKGARSVEEITSSIHIVQPDTSLYGTLKAVTEDSLSFAAEYDNAPFSCTYNTAMDEGHIFGSLTKGHRYALLVDPSCQDARHLLNITELSGRWFYDEAPESGLSFTAAGALSSINTHDVSFRKWKYYNGHIILYYINIEDVVKDSRNYKSDTTAILSLSADALTFRFRGETHSCHRQKEAIKVKF